MPNWCITNYEFEGKENNIKDFNTIIKNGIKKNLKENGFGENWIGNLVLSVGKDCNKIHCRGTIDYLSEPQKVDNDCYNFTIETCTAWGTMPQIFYEIIRDNNFDIQMRLTAVEPNMDVFLEYDEIYDNSPKYWVDYYSSEKTCSKALDELSEVILSEDDLNDYLDDIIDDSSTCKNLEEKIEKALQKYNSDNNIFVIAKMQYVKNIEDLF